MVVSLVFKPWNKFHAEMDPKVFQQYLELVGKESEYAFRRGSNRFKSGRIYRYNGRDVQASGPGDWPARQSGRLISSIKSIVTAREVEIGTNINYAAFLTYGTYKMAPRKMMKEALEEGMKNARRRLKNWVKWERG